MRFHLALQDEIVTALVAESRRTKTTQAQIVRDAIAAHLNITPPPRRKGDVPAPAQPHDIPPGVIIA